MSANWTFPSIFSYRCCVIACDTELRVSQFLYIGKVIQQTAVSNTLFTSNTTFIIEEKTCWELTPGLQMWEPCSIEMWGRSRALTAFLFHFPALSDAFLWVPAKYCGNVGPEICGALFGQTVWRIVNLVLSKTAEVQWMFSYTAERYLHATKTKTLQKWETCKSLCLSALAERHIHCDS